MTAKSLKIYDMDLSTVITTATSHSFVSQSVSNEGSSRSSITSLGAEKFAIQRDPYEVVYTEKTTEVDGSEDVLTLHYAYNEANLSVYDATKASESLLMLSRGNESEKGVPIISI